MTVTPRPTWYIALAFLCDYLRLAIIFILLAALVFGVPIVLILVSLSRRWGA